MKKLILLLVLIANFAFGQKCDTVIATSIYKSYYSQKLKAPLYVSYALYKGGGNCSRSSDRFISGGVKQTASKKDYLHTNYDEGHLANAEDFANDCTNEELTFRWFNCLPQTPKLNRGIWKVWETEIRKLSQKDTLFISCGGDFKNCKFIGQGVAVPNNCWKTVKNRKGDFIYVLWFPNDESDAVEKITIAELRKRIEFNLEL